METSANPARGSYVRSNLSWGRIVLLALLVAVILFVAEDRKGCGFFRYGAMEFAHFSGALAWMVIFFAVRLRWRLLVLAVTVPAALFYFGLHGIAEENAGREAAAVAELRRIHDGVQAYRSEHHGEFPASLQAAGLSAYSQKFYRYEYASRRDKSGEIVGYFIQATPKRRDCDFYLSFTITDDSKVFYTHQPRAATSGDKILE
jgi:hypothetical protein